MGVQWVDELPRSHRYGKWWKICQELRTRPGQWAMIHTGNNTAYATALKRGKLDGSEPGEFEATCRRRPDGKYDLYARYVGKSGEGVKARPSTAKSKKNSSNE